MLLAIVLAVVSGEIYHAFGISRANVQYVVILVFLPFTPVFLTYSLLFIEATFRSSGLGPPSASKKAPFVNFLIRRLERE